MNRLLLSPRPSFPSCRSRAVPVELDEVFSGNTWQITQSKPDEEDWVSSWPTRSPQAEVARAIDAHGPVAAGLRALAPDIARLHVYYTTAIAHAVAELRREHEDRIARFEREYEQRLEHVERAVLGRDPAAERGSAVLNRAIAQLREQLGDDLRELSVEEEAELWQRVDFTQLHERD